MRYTVAASDLGQVFGQLEEQISDANTAAMREATDGLKNELRQITRSAGLGNRLAGTWQGRTYPERGNSLDPSLYVWTKDDLLIDVFMRGATIVPLAGRKHVAVPTKAVPGDLRKRFKARGSSRRGLVAAVEERFGPLQLRRARQGRVLGFVEAVSARSKAGFKPATKGRIGQGRERKLVLMFVFTPTVKVRQRLDVDAAAQRWAGRVPALIEKHLASPTPRQGYEPDLVWLDNGTTVPRSSLPRWSGPAPSGWSRR